MGGMTRIKCRGHTHKAGAWMAPRMQEGGSNQCILWSDRASRQQIPRSSVNRSAQKHQHANLAISVSPESKYDCSIRALQFEGACIKSTHRCAIPRWQKQQTTTPKRLVRPRRTTATLSVCSQPASLKTASGAGMTRVERKHKTREDTKAKGE